MSKRPVLFDLTDAPAPDVAAAPMVQDMPSERLLPDGRAMQAVVGLRGPGRLVRWALALMGGLGATLLSLAAWDYAAALVARWPVLGWVVTGMMVALLAVLAGIALSELAGLVRLRRLDGLRRRADAALHAGDLSQARAVVAALSRHYRDRPDTGWGRARLAEQSDDQLDADALLGLAETTLLAPLDAAAAAQVETAARQVATVTALAPIALVDVAAALACNLRMIRRIAEIYGGRAGTLGSWRLFRAVLAHLLATGAVAVGDDLLEPVLGGTVLAKLSRRFGEGVVNGALTARVGLAAIEVCRPLPFAARPRPKVGALVRRALAGLVPGTGKAASPSAEPPA